MNNDKTIEKNIHNLKISTFITVVLLYGFMILGFALPVRLIWNRIIPEISNFHEITYFQAAALVALAQSLNCMYIKIFGGDK